MYLPSRDTLKHELAHYASYTAITEKHDTPHNQRFIKLCEKLGCSSEDLLYSTHALFDNSWFFGKTIEKMMPNGEINMTILKKPNWEIFRDEVLYKWGHEGDLFMTLRKRMGKSRKQVARKMGVSEYTIKKTGVSSEFMWTGITL